MKAFFLVLLMWVLISPGCTRQEEYNDPGLKEKSARLVTENNHFGLDFFREVYAQEKEMPNIMVSPLSAALALAMTYNGAEAGTREAMEKTLRFNGFTREEINASFHSLVNALQSADDKVLLEIANAIYYRQGFQVEENFVAVNRKYYNAWVTGLDFGSPASLEVINGWVKEKTHGKIPSILDRISCDHVMFLLNAIFFKGVWTKEFNPKATARAMFTTGDGRQIETEMMNRNDTLDYLRNDLFSAIRLPYGKGDYNMVVILPLPEQSLSRLVEQLTAEKWKQWTKGFAKTKDVEISLPKLKYSYDILLNDVLTRMGMGVAFTDGADFSGINRAGGLRIDFVKQKSYLEVNEEGTEAAAATIVAIEKTSFNPQKIRFIVNRPFLFAITEKSTNAILFVGTVKDPLSGGK